MGKIVVSEFISLVSSTLAEPSWNNSTVLRSTEGVAGLKDQYDGDILGAGSATLVRGLTEPKSAPKG